MAESSTLLDGILESMEPTPSEADIYSEACNDDLDENLLSCDDETGQIESLEEYETSLYIPISKDIYDTLLMESARQDTYFVGYFMDNIRLAHDKIQLKIVRKKQHVIKIIYYEDKPYFIPYKRSYASEFPAAIPETSKLESAIIRTVIYNKVWDLCTMRVALEERSDAKGGQYAFTAEVEYDDATYESYTQSRDAETIFFDTIVSKYFYKLKEVDFQSLFNFNSCDIVGYNSRKFRLLHKQYSISDNEKLMFKLDGYKCKFGYTENGHFVFHDALNNIYGGVCEPLKEFRNIVFQGEILENKTIFIVDILGGYTSYKKDLYMPDPLEAIEFFGWFRSHLKRCNVGQVSMELSSQSVVKYQFDVHTQFFVDPENPQTDYKIDGYIIISNGGLYKFKKPTIEARAFDGYLYIYGETNMLSTVHHKKLIDSAIYEVCESPKKNSEYIILKLRKDRISPGTREQKEEQKHELEFLRNAMTAGTSEKLKSGLKKISGQLSITQ